MVLLAGWLVGCSVDQPAENLFRELQELKEVNSYSGGVPLVEFIDLY